MLCVSEDKVIKDDDADNIRYCRSRRTQITAAATSTAVADQL